MTRTSQCLFIASALGILGCQSSPVSTTEVSQLFAAEAKWATKGFSDYSVEVLISCGECPPHSNQWVRVEVVDGTFLRAEIVATGEDISDEFLGLRTPVESQFAWIRQANNQPDLEDLQVTFDEQLGYPSYVASRYDPALMDAGGAVRLRAVKPLTP